eukprot:scaffold4491_cov119-Isochrysis_galbana.AAC.2
MRSAAATRAVFVWKRRLAGVKLSGTVDRKPRTTQRRADPGIVTGPRVRPVSFAPPRPPCPKSECPLIRDRHLGSLVISLFT